ncbi:hypothetical protein [Amycolatopsis sp. NPDC051903]
MDAEADRVGFGKFGDEAVAEVRRVVVVVSKAFSHSGRVIWSGE